MGRGDGGTGDNAEYVSLHGVIQSQNAESAKALKQTLLRIYKAIEENKEILKVAPDIAKFTAMLTPEVAGERLTLTLNQKQVDTLLFDLLSPSLLRARQQAIIVVSMHNMRRIGLSIHMFASDNKNTFPESLQLLVEKEFLVPQLLVNPRWPKRKPEFLYIKPGKKLSKIPPQSLLVYGAFYQWPEGGINVYFVDSHVERIMDQARFKKLLAETKGPQKPAKSKPTEK